MRDGDIDEVGEKDSEFIDMQWCMYMYVLIPIQYKQVQAFIPEIFHKIKVVHETQEGRVEFNWKRLFS